VVPAPRVVLEEAPWHADGVRHCVQLLPGVCQQMAELAEAQPCAGVCTNAVDVASHLPGEDTVPRPAPARPQRPCGGSPELPTRLVRSPGTHGGGDPWLGCSSFWPGCSRPASRSR